MPLPVSLVANGDLYEVTCSLSLGLRSVISPNVISSDTISEAALDTACVLLVRYGQIPQVAKFVVSADTFEAGSQVPGRDSQVVVETDRGLELGRVLDVLKQGIVDPDKPASGNVVRVASSDDLQTQAQLRQTANSEYDVWMKRIADWKLQLQLIDVEWTLDRQQVVLYVLNGQNAEVTRLALLTAAAGLGIVHVQPVAADGLVPKPSSGGGCGSGGGGCGSGGCGH